MLRNALHLCALAVLGTTAAAVAQNPPPRQPPPPPAGNPPAVAGPADRTTTPGQAFRVKQVLGSKISISGNIAIGTVDDIVFSDDGHIEYLIVQNENKLVTVPWEAAKFDFKAQTAVVTITEEKFRAVPTYTVREYPNFALPAYRTEIYRFYNLTPRQERKLDRQLDRRDR
jgi:hypothetical protein